MIVRPATLAALLCCVFALFVAGCGDDKPSQESGAAPTQTQVGGEEQGGETDQEREKEEEEAAAAGAKECSEVGDLDGEPKHQPPDDVKILDGAKVYESEGPFGKTERFFAAVDGEAGDLPAKRDAA